MKKVIIIIIAVLLLITTGTIIGLNKFGGEIIDRFIDSELSAIGQADQSAEVKQGNSETAIDSNEGDNSSQTDSPAASSNDDASQNASGTAVDNLAQYRSTGVQVNDKTQVITIQEANEIKDQVTAKDKVTAAALVLKRLSSKDISELKGLMNGGLTAEKKQKAIRIAYARFTPEEIVQIKELYRKYMK